MNKFKLNEKISFSGIDIQQKKIGVKINTSIARVIETNKFIMGPEVSALEEKLSCYLNTNFSISCANGTDALSLALIALDFRRGDNVIVPSFTFISTAESALILGINPIFVDINSDNYSINYNQLKSVYSESKRKGIKIKGIINVDLFGIPSNYKVLKDFCKDNKLKLITDAAQALGAKYKKEFISNFTDITTTSFFPSKPLGCYGDGGCLFTNSKSIATKLKSLRIHGKGINKYDNISVGMNSRLDTIQATILLEKLKTFSKELKRRKEVAKLYLENITDMVIKPYVDKDSDPIWSQFTIRTKKRDKLKAFLEANKIPTMIYYPIPLHKQKAYKKFKILTNSLVNSEDACNQVVSIPIHGYISNLEVDKIISYINKFFKNK